METNDIMTREKQVLADESVNERYADQHPQSPWISVQDELPPNNEDVLVAYKDRFRNMAISVAVAAYADDWWYSAIDEKDKHNIKYWMPIPPLS